MDDNNTIANSKQGTTTATYRKKGTWSPSEDAILESMVFLDKPNNWSHISSRIPGRTAKQCRERWKCNLNPNIKKAAWTPDEDEILIRMQRELGNRWAVIAKSLNGRTENAIKTRFRSILRAQRKRWSPEEDQKVLTMRNLQRCRWETIAAALPNRTKNGVKIRFKYLTSVETSSSGGNLTNENESPKVLNAQNIIKSLSRSSSDTSEAPSMQGTESMKPSLDSKYLSPQLSATSLVSPLSHANFGNFSNTLALFQQVMEQPGKFSPPSNTTSWPDPKPSLLSQLLGTAGPEQKYLGTKRSLFEANNIDTTPPSPFSKRPCIERTIALSLVNLYKTHL